MKLLLDTDRLKLIRFSNTLDPNARGCVEVEITNDECKELFETWNKFMEFQDKLRELAKAKGMRL